MSVEHHQRRTRREALTARQGALAGLLGGLVLAASASTASHLAGRGLWTPINAAACFFASLRPIPTEAHGLLSALGVIVVLAVAALLGMLYATAQEALDAPSLVLIAVYYGLVTWIVATVLVLSWLNPAVKAVWQSWPVLAGHLLYGLTLGAVAATRLHEPEKT